jgi:nitrite reductase/ring-hydroxylating ferredoxin subunit
MARLLVGKTSELGEGKMTHITAAGKEVLVANVGGNYYATNNTCAHAGAELHEGSLKGKELTCPWHGARWDVTTGSLVWFPQKLKDIGKYNVVVENDTIYLEI